MITNKRGIQRGVKVFKQLKDGWTVVKIDFSDVVQKVRAVLRCRQVAPVLSADGTLLQASSSCGSGVQTNQMMGIKRQQREMRH